MQDSILFKVENKFELKYIKSLMRIQNSTNKSYMKIQNFINSFAFSSFYAFFKELNKSQSYASPRDVEPEWRFIILDSSERSEAEVFCQSNIIGGTLMFQLSLYKLLTIEALEYHKLTSTKNKIIIAGKYLSCNTDKIDNPSVFLPVYFIDLT